MSKPLFLIITSGDRDGVGLEVTRKALTKIGPQRSARFLITCSDSISAKKELARLSGFKLVYLSSHEASLEIASQIFNDLQCDEILVWCDSGNEAEWVRSAALLALKGKIDGIVTGPVSKGRFRKLNSNYMGHTGMLSALSSVSIVQGYVGPKLNVVLATDHVPLAQVERGLRRQTLMHTIECAKKLRSGLNAHLRAKPIALLGLNPHAGENGLIGRFEKNLQIPRGIVGPLPPDAAFMPLSLKKYSVIVALYHDQGLIPFKLVHGQDSGFQISLGLPFVRTSVDHGTAQDIFGQNVANPGSMIDAIKGALHFAKNEDFII